MLLLECPNCGRRSVSEFRFGAAYNPRPRPDHEVGAEEWAEYLYVRRNLMGVQQEWWHHANGCGLWFLAERDTRTNEVKGTRMWAAAEGAPPGAESGDGSVEAV